MKRIVTDFIDDTLQRYPTVGDYYYGKKGVLHIKVSNTGNEYMDRLIMIHELIEEMLTMKRGISEPDIMEFDLKFEQEMEKGLHSPTDEPGNAPNCIYRKEHFFAESIERLCAHELGINWEEYSLIVNDL